MSVKILTTYAWYKPVGLGKRLRRAVIALAEAGMQVDWVGVTPADIDHPRVAFHLLGAKEELKDSMPNHKSRFPWFFYMWNASRECLIIAREPEVKCLMAFSYGSSFPLLLARLATKKPLVIFLRSNEIQENKIKNAALYMRIIFCILERFSANLAAHIIPITAAISQSMQDRYGKGMAKKMTVLHNDIPEVPDDINRCREDVVKLVGRNDAFVIVSSGPFNERKNFSMLIKAFATLKNKTAMLLLIGKGPLMADHKKLAEELKVDDRVIFAGWRDNTPSLTAGSDLFILPSMAEGVSNSLLEALTAGVPCLISDIPEHREITTDMEILFSLDNLKSLSEKLSKAVNGGEYLHDITNTAKEMAGNLDFDWNQEITEIIRTVCD